LRVNRKRLRRFVEEAGIEAIASKRWTSMPNAAHRKYPYLLKGLEINRTAAAHTSSPPMKSPIYSPTKSSTPRKIISPRKIGACFVAKTMHNLQHERRHGT
jgi:hypothetical protein